IARPFRAMPHRMREAARNSLEIGENPVAPFVMQAAEGGTEELTVIHRNTCKGELRAGAPVLFRAFPALLSSRNRAALTQWTRDRVAAGAGRMLTQINTPAARLGACDIVGSCHGRTRLGAPRDRCHSYLAGFEAAAGRMVGTASAARRGRRDVAGGRRCEARGRRLRWRARRMVVDCRQRPVARPDLLPRWRLLLRLD